jgi:hypothetical protein
MVSEPISSSRVDLDTGVPLDAKDRKTLADVEPSLAVGIDLLRWSQKVLAQGSYAQQFPIIAQFNLPAQSYGFFDQATVAGRPLPVMGVFQEQLYDKPKSPRGYEQVAAEWLRAQVEEFVLRYFMRVSSFAAPQAFVDADRHPPSGLIGNLSWCPGGPEQLGGFGYQQVYYKRAADGQVRKFAAADQARIVDLREIGPSYDWLVALVNVYAFNLSLSLRNLKNSPELVVPLEEKSYLILSPEFIANDSRPEPGVLGRYGLGYAFLRLQEPSLVAYGPGEFKAAFQTIQFKVLESGEVRVCMLFVVNRPDRILNLSLNPFEWGMRMADWMSFGMASRLTAPLFGDAGKPPGGGTPGGGTAGGGTPGGVDPVFAGIALANMLSGGYTSRELCITKEQLEKIFLVKHYMQHYQTIAGSLMTWRMIADWLDTAALPDWVRRGGVA